MNRTPIQRNKETGRTIAKPGARRNSRTLKVMSLAKSRDAAGVPGTRRVAEKKAAATAKSKQTKQIPRRGDLNANGTKRKKSQDETRDSTRAQARGRSEFTGRLNKSARGAGQRRVSKTGTKSS